jgi:hypothetical protein
MVIRNALRTFSGCRSGTRHSNTSSHALNAAFYSLQHDVLNDFSPISPLVIGSLALYGRKTIPASGLNGLIGWLKASQKYLKFQHQPMCVN